MLATDRASHLTERPPGPPLSVFPKGGEGEAAVAARGRGRMTCSDAAAACFRQDCRRGRHACRRGSGRGVCGFVVVSQEGNVMHAALHARNGRTGGRWLRGIQPLALLACALFSACASTQMASQRANGAGSGAEERTSSPTNAPRPSPALLPAPALSATAYVLIDPTSGVVHLSHNARAQLPMASTTKIMTALVA